MSVGALGFIGIGVESSGGTTNGSAAINNYAPFVSENLVVTRDDLDSQNIMAQWDQEKVYNGLQRVQGTIQTQAHPLTTGFFLRTVFDSTTTAPGCAAIAFPWYSNSHAGVRAHRFYTGQTQFQAGSGSDLPTLTYEINRGPVMGTGSSFAYYNCAGSALEFTIEAGQLARVSVDVIGREYGGLPRSTPSFPPTDAFLWSQCSVQIGGAATTLFESLTIRLDNQLDAVAKLDGRLRPDLIKRNGFRTVTVNGRVQFQTYSEYDRFVQGSETGMKLIFTGGQVSTAPTNNNMLVIDLPAMRYSTFPLNIGGPQRISVDFTGRATFHQGSGTAMEMCLVNTRISNYHINSNG